MINTGGVDGECERRYDGWRRRRSIQIWCGKGANGGRVRRECTKVDVAKAVDRSAAGGHEKILKP